jgi:hypothetical protein
MRMNGNVVALANRAEEQQTLRRLRRMKTVSVFTKMSLSDAWPPSVVEANALWAVKIQGFVGLSCALLVDL